MRDAGKSKQQRGDETGSVLAAHAMDHDRSGGIRDGRERLAEAAPVALEEVDVRERVVIGDVVNSVDVGIERSKIVEALGDVRSEHRDVDDLDVDVPRRVFRQFLRPTKVDDSGDAVLGQGAPAGLAQRPDVVRPDDRAGSGDGAVLRWKAAEVAHVDAPVPQQRSRARLVDHDRGMVSASVGRSDATLQSVTAPLPELPRVRLLDGPTPLQRMERLSAALDGRAELWIKREDAGPIPFSGNKLRNLEFVLAGAIADGSDTIVTSGRRWSNHCRLAAVAGTRFGLDVHLVLGGPHVDHAPNVELIELFGGTVHRAITADRAEREAIVDLVAADLRRQGRRVTVVPVGGSGAIGAWGQVLAALEVAEQSAAAGLRPDAIVLPSASGGTQAGLVVGSAVVALADENGMAPTRVVGMVVARPEEEVRPIIEGLVGELATLAGIDAPAIDAIELDGSPIGAGYGLPTQAATEAAALLARTEGILVDPVYTAKALAGLIDRVRAGAFDGQRVIFWHGGGLPALFEDLTGSA